MDDISVGIQKFKNIINSTVDDNDINVLKEFLEKNKDCFSIDSINRENCDLLIYAINSRCAIGVIEFIINNCKKYKTTLNYETIQGEIPLFIAFTKAISERINDSITVKEYYMRVFNVLEKYGASINFCNSKGDNLLVYVYDKNLLNEDVFKLLFSKSINVGTFLEKLFLKSEEFETEFENNNNDEGEMNDIDNPWKNDFNKYLRLALHLNKYRHKTNYIITLLNMYKNKVKLSKEKLEKLHIEYKFDFSVHIPFDYLCKLIERNQYEMIEYLLGKDVKIFNNNFELNYDTYQMTRKYLKRMNAETNNKINLNILEDELKDALSNHNIEKADFIIDQGFNVAYDPHKCYHDICFIKACKELNFESIKYLVEHGSKINQHVYCCYNDGDGLQWTMKHFSSTNNNQKDIIKYLLNHEGYFSITLGDYNSIVKNIKVIDEEFYYYLIEYGFNIYKTLNDHGFISTLNCFSQIYIELKEIIKSKNFTSFVDELYCEGFLQIIYNYRFYNKENNFVKALMNMKVCTNCAACDWGRLVNYACADNDLEMVKFLIEHGVDINKLLSSCNSSNNKIVKYLIEHGVDIKNSENNRKSLLLDAFTNNNIEMINYLLPNNDTKLNLNQYSKNEKTTLLILACQHGHLKYVKYFLDQGINPKSIDQYNNTPLYYACFYGYLDIVKLLVKYSNPTEKKKFGGVDDEKSENKYYKEINDDEDEYNDSDDDDDDDKDMNILFNTNGNGETLLITACHRGHLEIIKYLLYCHLDVNLGDKYGNTPIMIACRHGHLDIVKYFVEYKYDNGSVVDINQKNLYGLTPLMVALTNGYYDIVEFLLHHQARFNEQEKKNTELKQAYINRDFSIIIKNINDFLKTDDELYENLINDGQCQNNKYINSKYFFINYACIKNNIDMVRYLIENEVNENVPNYCITSLMIACIGHNVELIKLLVEHNITNINKGYCNNSIYNLKYCYQYKRSDHIGREYYNFEKDDCFAGYTPLLFLAHHQDMKIIKYLIEHGANVNVKSSNNSTLFSILNNQNKYELIKYVIENEINISGGIGHDALIYYTKNNDYSMIQNIIEYHIRINDDHSLKCLLILLFLQHRHMNLLKALIVDDNADTLLMYDLNIKGIVEYSQDLLSILKNNNYEFVKEKIKTFNSSDQKNKFIKLLFLLLIKENDMDLLAILMDPIYDININNKYPSEHITIEDETLLMTACRMNHLPTAQYFIDNSLIKNLNQSTDILRNTPLIYACEYNAMDIVKLLVESGCDIHQQNINGYSAVDIACINGYTPLFLYLVDCGASLKRHDPLEKKSLLIMACQFGALEMVEYLLNKYSEFYITNKNIDVIDSRKRTALMYACQRGHYDIVNCLIQHKANINIVSQYSGNALGYACEVGNSQIVKLLLDSGSDIDIPGKFGETEFIKGCKSNFMALVKYLIEYKADINIQDRRGYTGLMRACENKNLEMILFLVEQGANIHLCNDYGYNAFIMLCDDYRNIKIIKRFIQKGINMHHRTKKDGITALIMACDHEQYELAKYLIRKGSSVNEYDWKRRTPLMKSIMKGNFKFSKYLIENGANCFCYDKDGQSILDYCIKYHQHNLLKYFIHCHIFDNKLSKYNTDTLLLACQKNNFYMVKYLIDHGVNINNNSKTISYVFKNCSLKMIIYLIEHWIHIKKEDLLSINFDSMYFGHFDIQKPNKKLEKVIRYLFEHGVNLFQYALNNEDLDLVKWLITLGIDVNEKDENNHTILNILVFHLKQKLKCNNRKYIQNLFKLLKYLHELGARIEENIFNIIPIENFYEYEVLEIAIYLLDEDEYVRENNDISFLLIESCLKSNYEVVKQLINKSNLSDENKNINGSNESRDNNTNNNSNNDDESGNGNNNNSDYHLSIDNYFIALVYSSMKNDLEIVKLIVNHIGDVNKQQERQYIRKYTALQWAFWNKNNEMVKYLVDHGADANNLLEWSGCSLVDSNKNQFIHKDMINCLLEIGYNKTKALMMACTMGHIDMVNYFVTHQANINIIDDQGNSPLILACKNNDFKLVQYLVEHLAKVNLIVNYDTKKYTALQTAIIKNNYDIFKYLLDHGANSESLKPNQEESYPLFDSVNKKIDVRIRNYLLQNGFQIYKNKIILIKEKPTSTSSLNLKSNLKIDSNNNLKLLLSACQNEDLQQIKDLVNISNSTKVDINALDSYGRYPLLISCRKGNLNIIKYLIEHGADPNVHNINDYTSIMAACHYGHLDVVKLLMEYGANLHLVNKLGDSALFISYKYGHYDITKYLLDSGIDINTRGKYGTSLLMKACERCHYKFVKYLVSKGANVNHQNDIKDTPLIYACEQNNLRIIKFLVKHGASIASSNIYYDTPLSIANKNNSIIIIKYLKSQERLNIYNII